MAIDELVGYDAHRPDITLQIVFLVFVNFWSHGDGGPTICLHVGCYVLSLSKSKIREFGHTLSVNENVSQFNVSVHDIVFVECPNCIRYLQQQFLCRLFRHALPKILMHVFL